jgi:subtilisin family serine protease
VVRLATFHVAARKQHEKFKRRIVRNVCSGVAIATLLLLCSPLVGKSTDVSPKFVGNFLVKVVEVPQAASIRVENASTLQQDGWVVQSLSPVPHAAALTRNSETSQEGDWKLFTPRTIARDIAARVSAKSEPITIGRSLNFREGWSRTYQQFEADTIADQPSVRRAAAQRGWLIQAIEPNFSLPLEVKPTLPLKISGCQATGFSTGCIGTVANPAWPNGNGFAWHLKDGSKDRDAKIQTGYSQLRTARLIVADKNHKQAVALIAHLDTGYDNHHISRPRCFDSNLSVTIDPASGQIISGQGHAGESGHGTGTLGVLAGAHVSIPGKFDDDLGGAPNENVFEVKINNGGPFGGVVHLSTASMAAGIRYATSKNADVISLSAGGIPSQAWGEAVDAAYEHGTAIFAAAGDFLAIPVFGFPVTPFHTVYPAAFSRVESVTGATASLHSYGLRGTLAALLPWHWGDAVLRGSYGPIAEMGHTIAAYTPNVPWAVFENSETTHRRFDLNGGGTSASTPQVAAAAALWIAYYHDLLPSHQSSAGAWRRAEAVYKALEDTAWRGDYNPLYRVEFFGRGLLRAADALKSGHSEKLSKRDRSILGPAWLVNLFTPVPLLAARLNQKQSTSTATENVQKRMELIEAAQIVAQSRKLQGMIHAIEKRAYPNQPQRKNYKTVIRALVVDRRCSNELRGTLTEWLKTQN